MGKKLDPYTREIREDDSFSIEDIEDGEVTNAMLASDCKVGSLADLETTADESTVAAINEINAKVASNQAASTATTVADAVTDLNTLIASLKASGQMEPDA